MIIPVTAVFASLTALLMIILAFRVSTFRLKYQKSLGHTDDRDFESAVRSHANLTEYAPIALILMAVGELNGVSAQAVYGVGMVFVVGRLLHVWGMYQGRGGAHKGRLYGILMSWVAILVMAVLALWNVISLS